MRLKHRWKCQFCKSVDLTLVLDLGPMPLVGDFLKKKDVGKEKSYPIRLWCCENCGLIQLLDITPKEELFQSFLTGYSLTKHFERFAREMVYRFLKKGDFVVEIGSNDGTLLKFLKDLGMDVLGIEPISYIAKLSKDKGLPTITKFFSLKVAKTIKRQADAIFANNVLAHIDDIADTFRGIKYLLKDDGILVFEVHHVYNIFAQKQWDNVYQEHLYYYSVAPLANLLAKYGLEITEIKPIKSHGGSIRVYARKMPKIDLQKYAEDHKEKLVKLLKDLKAKGKKIIGYGASGRGNVLLNFCGINSEIIDYIIDEAPTRYNRYTPGTHIPVVPKDKFDGADYILLLAWNYEKEIKKKMKGFKGKYIIPFPEVHIT